MKIKLNNNEEIFEASEMTISQLLEEKKYTFKMLVIKINGEIVKKDLYPVTKVKEGDDVIVLHLMSGG
jgi:thiamine biosynthesis protein ThiS